MSSARSPAVPTFSYAQAAQGLTRPGQNQVKPPAASSVSSEQNAKDTKSTSVEPAKPAASATQISGKASSDTSSSITKDDISESKPLTTEIETPAPTQTSPSKPQMTTTDTASTSVSSSSLQGTPDLNPQDHSEGFATRHQEGSEVSESQIQTPGGSDKVSVTSEKKKSKEEDFDWEHVSSPLMPVEKELKPAPIPAVNFWTQRKAEQEARARELSSQRSSAVAMPTRTKPVSSTEQTKRKTNDKAVPNVEKEGEMSPKKEGDVPQGAETARREQEIPSSRPTSQHKNMSMSDTLPPVRDAESWPTPDTATTDDRRKSSSFEKPEKPENKTAEAKSHRDKWVTMPFVPTAVFNTPLPPSARRGGRGGGRGRDGMGRGSSNQNNGTSEKTETTGTMGPPPLPKQQDQERGRKHDSGRGGRATSLPTQSRRDDSGSAQASESRKPSETPMRERNRQVQGKFVQPETPRSTSSNELNDLSNVPANEQLSRPPTNSTEQVQPGPIYSEPQEAKTDETHAHPGPENTWKSSQGEWNRGSNTSGRGGGEGPKERFSKPRERPEYGRDSWRDRDRENQWETGSRREPRSERGRGSYRGRGSHQNFGSHPNTGQSYTAPLPQQPFPGSKSNSFSDSRRQSSQPYPQIQVASGNQANPRSQSIPSPHTYAHYTTAMNAPLIPMSPIQDPAMYGYVQIPGIMPTMPPALGEYGFYSLILKQLEYYLSVDNLCKDMHLRKYMDSQGWIPLKLIAGFNRMKQLTEDLNLIRAICLSSQDLDFLPGENGQPDLVRSKEHWHKFVLNVEERFPEAQHDGPRIENVANSRTIANGYPRFTDPYFNTAAQTRSIGWHPGMFTGATTISPVGQPNAGHFDMGTSALPATGDIALSPAEHTLPLTFGSFGQENEVEAAQPANGTDSDANVNGTPSQARSSRSDAGNTFPDEQIPDLTILIRKPGDQSMPNQPPFMSFANRTFSHGSVDDVPQVTSPPSEHSPAPTSGLRGGAGSPDQLEKLQFARPNPLGMPESFEAPPVLWAKNGSAHMIVEQKDIAHESYLAVRERALQQREQGLIGEDLTVLYKFWSHFLVRNFNLGMYEEFHDLALDDLQTGSGIGCQHLARYYEALLSSKTSITDLIARDIVEIADKEDGDARIVYPILRSAWRDGAFNLKSRKKITDLLNPTLRAELDK